ncbi:reverse transcriptase domain-containing protein [Tanacetum coccineum]
MINPRSSVVTMDDNGTMAQLLEAPTEGYEDAIVVPEITADNFELKHGLLTLVQNKQFFGHDKEDPHAHIRYFKQITSRMKFPNVSSMSVKLMLFLFSLEGAAWIWLEKEPSRSILTWDGLVSKFINKLFPPSKTTNLRNEITRFQQRFDESFYEAWDRFNDLLQGHAPHQGYTFKFLLTPHIQEKTKFAESLWNIRYRRMPLAYAMHGHVPNGCMMAILYDMIGKKRGSLHWTLLVFGIHSEIAFYRVARFSKRTVGENRASWLDKLDDALWVFHTAYKTPIRCTPYKLVYGKACHLLIEVEHKAYWALKHANFDLETAGDHRKVQLNELNKLRDHDYENSLIYKEKTKRIPDSKIKNRFFNVGDQVLLFNSRLKMFLGKLKSRWSGPFTIAHVFPYGTVELSQNSGPNFKVNGHRIKHYFRGDVPQMVFPDLQTFPKDK